MRPSLGVGGGTVSLMAGPGDNDSLLERFGIIRRRGGIQPYAQTFSAGYRENHMLQPYDAPAAL